MNQAHNNCIIFNKKSFRIAEEHFAFVSYLSAKDTCIFQWEICLQMREVQLAANGQTINFPELPKKATG